MSNRRFTLLLTATLAVSATNAIAQKDVPDPTYIRQYPSTITVKTFLGENIAGFSLVDGKNDEKLLYRPNNVLALGVGVTIKGFGLSFSTRLPYHDPKEDRYGKTEKTDFQLHRYKGKFAFDGYYQRYTGYHLRDSSDVTAVITHTDYPYFPDMQNITVGVTGMYVFNGTRYSLRAPFDQQDWQVRSSGSWLLGGSIFAHIIDNNNQSMIPPYLKRPDFMSGNQVKAVNNYGATLNGGYGYNYIIHEHWFISATLDVGAGLGFSELKDKAGSSHKVGLQLSSNGRFAVGYNSLKWFAGFYAIYHVDKYNLPYEQCYLGSGDGLARFTVARRLIIGHHSKS